MTQKKKSAANVTLPVRPMNDDAADQPLAYPLAALSSLSADAQAMHPFRRGQRLDRDVFDGQRLDRFVPREERDAFVPTERMLAGIAELEAAGLATYNPKYVTLSTQRLHEHYTFAQGRGSQFIKVGVFDDHPDDARLLAVLIGGDLETRNGDSSRPEIALRVRHESATDSEHDASSTALLLVRNMSQPVFRGYGHVSFTGVLTEANLYPIGIDSLLADDGESRPGDTCTDCDEHHPFAPYLPPKVDSLSGAHFVTVEAWPFRPYLVAAPRALDSNQSNESPQ